MLRIKLPEIELFDEVKEEFTNIKSQTIEIEHSLSAIAKWESRWKKPFFSREEKTEKESIEYIRCMTLNDVEDDRVYRYLPSVVFEKIVEYMSDDMTATTFSDFQVSPRREIITSEIIYYWMTVSNIPFECDKWHINRLLALIRVCNIKNTPPKKMSRREVRQQNAELNAIRRARLHTKG